MRLLILTQKIDKNDDVLGFFHNWLKVFSGKFEKIIAVCLQKGEVDLPENVTVLSLGKEKNYSRFQTVKEFYKIVWQERKNYDAVFVHMNQEYVLLGGIFWRIMGKKVYMWRNHPANNVLTRIAVVFCSKTFCTSPASFIAKYEKNIIMPVGIDTELFKRVDNERVSGLVLSLGRISKIKNVYHIVDAVRRVKERGMKPRLRVIGNPITQTDREYFAQVKEEVKNRKMEDFVEFVPGVPNRLVPKEISKAEIFVNMTLDGTLDKTIFEAMACEVIVIASYDALRGVLPDDNIARKENGDDLGIKIEKALTMPQDKKKELQEKMRKYVEEKQSLALLAEKLSLLIS